VVSIPMTVSLPLLGTVVRSADGVDVNQEGDSVTFTPKDAIRVVAPGGSVGFTFEIDGVTKPSACTVNGQPCSGVGNNT
jgi:endoglucanase